MIKIVITDDHPMVISGLKTILSFESDFKVIHTFQSGIALKNAMPNLDVDVLLLDIRLPNTDGVLLILDLLQIKPTLKVIILSSYDDKKLISTAIINGAYGYLCKDADATELIKAIRTVNNGETYIAERLAIKFKNTKEITENNDAITKREFQLLELILKEFTTKEIAEKLSISAKTAENYRHNLMQKLGVKNTAGLVRAAIKRNIISLH